MIFTDASNIVGIITPLLLLSKFSAIKLALKQTWQKKKKNENSIGNIWNATKLIKQFENYFWFEITNQMICLC